MLYGRCQMAPSTPRTNGEIRPTGRGEQEPSDEPVGSSITERRHDGPRSDASASACLGTAQASGPKSRSWQVYTGLNLQSGVGGGETQRKTRRLANGARPRKYLQPGDDGSKRGRTAAHDSNPWRRFQQASLLKSRQDRLTTEPDRPGRVPTDRGAPGLQPSMSRSMTAASRKSCRGGGREHRAASGPPRRCAFQEGHSQRKSVRTWVRVVREQRAAMREVKGGAQTRAPRCGAITRSCQ